MKKTIDFVHLHLHSEFSLLDGLCRFTSLLDKVASFGQKAVALTDHGNLHGSLAFYNQALAHPGGIKPIIGCELYVAKKSRFDKQISPGSDQYHLVVLAKNNQGYQNLTKLVTKANLEGFSYKPRIDEELLFAHHQGLILLSACLKSPINQLIINNKVEEALERAKTYQQVFGKDFYFELQSHSAIKEQDIVNRQLISWSRQENIPLVATNDVHYLEPEDALAQDALLAVQTRKLLADKNRFSMMSSPDYFYRSPEEMAELFAGLPEALANTVAIAEQCELNIERGKLHFPSFPIPSGESNESYFRQLTLAGLKKKYGTLSDEIKQRADYEMDVICKKGYVNYFLITQDFVNWAKSSGIGVGPGRGSAAGSVVSYGLNITTIDPIYHNLPFERFLNPQRPTPPDIDMDFADDKRDQVLSYVSQKYGADKVAQVITFGKMEARVAVRDIGRVLGFPYEEPDRIAKLIPNDPGKKMSFKNALQQIPELQVMAKQSKYKQLFSLVQKVEGIVRHHSVHAAAVIVGDKDLTEYIAIQKDSKTGNTITQVDMRVLDVNIADDAIGLLKFDFLGLRNLSIIDRAIYLINKYKNIKLDIATIPIDDKKTFKLLQAGDTMGVFQLESAGMRRVAKNLQPDQFSDITALVALYRPGPMDLIPKFIEGKHAPDKIVYLHPDLKPILGPTYGVLVYQEQVLQIANVMAGYSLGEADILRRAIGKKKKLLLDENRDRFIKQAITKGYDKKVLEEIWGFIEAFANYGFNKAHAASYAMIAYQTAYLKANYPVEYMAALISIESASTSLKRDEKIMVAVDNCKRMGIKILPPDINLSGRDFEIEENKASLQGLAIRYGLTGIKGIGEAAIEHIMQVRRQVGSFSSFTHFISETQKNKVNKKTLEALIRVGVFDAFANRATLLANAQQVRQVAGKLANDDGQDDLFASVEEIELTDNFATQEEYPQAELLSFEKELLGFYLTSHPMAEALQAAKSQASKQIGDLILETDENNTYVFGGMITQFRPVTTKKGEAMGFGQFEDGSGSVEFVIFPKTYAQSQSLCHSDQVVIMRAKIQNRDGELNLQVERLSRPDINNLNDIQLKNMKKIFLERGTPLSTMQEIGKLLKASPGDDQVLITTSSVAGMKNTILPYKVNWTPALEKQIKALLEK